MSQRYIVHHDDFGPEGWACNSYDEEGAALAFAEIYNEDGDYDLSHGSTTEVEVENEKGEKRKFEISAEASIDYSAREVKS